MKGLYTFKNAFLCNKSSRVIYGQLFFLYFKAGATQFLIFLYWCLLGHFTPVPTRPRWGLLTAFLVVHAVTLWEMSRIAKDVGMCRTLCGQRLGAGKGWSRACRRSGSAPQHRERGRANTGLCRAGCPMAASVMNGLFSVGCPRGGKREKTAGRRWEIRVSLEILERKMEVKEQDAFKSWKGAYWLVYCVCSWKTFAYAFKWSEVSGLDSDLYLAWVLIQLGIYWKRNREEGRGMPFCRQWLLTMPVCYTSCHTTGKRPHQLCP